MTEWPKNFPELFIAVMMLMALGTWQLIRWITTRQDKKLDKIVTKTQKLDEIGKIVETQERIAVILDNHMTAIGENLATIQVALDITVDRLLDAALRRPEEEPKEQ